MRPVLALVALALVSGCLGSNEGALAPAAAAPAPLELSGTVWLPPSQGEAREETLVSVPGAWASATFTARVVLAGSYVVETPPLLADVVVELRDASGEVLADAHLASGSEEAELSATIAAPGDAALAVLSYGGSDGSANGDRVEYEIALR